MKLLQKISRSNDYIHIADRRKALQSFINYRNNVKQVFIMNTNLHKINKNLHQINNDLHQINNDLHQINKDLHQINKISNMVIQKLQNKIKELEKPIIKNK